MNNQALDLQSETPFAEPRYHTVVGREAEVGTPGSCLGVLARWGCRGKIPPVGRLGQQTFLSYNSGGWKGRSQEWAGLAPPEASLLYCVDARLLPRASWGLLSVCLCPGVVFF